VIVANRVLSNVEYIGVGIYMGMQTGLSFVLRSERRTCSHDPEFHVIGNASAEKVDL
jgi:hypothetical protein